ncbi:MAG: hypothetical protein IT497_03920 [Ottowia sp.]|nr:hypothetical protein [Ottowia sp.]
MSSCAGASKKTVSREEAARRLADYQNTFGKESSDTPKQAKVTATLSTVRNVQADAASAIPSAPPPIDAASVVPSAPPPPTPPMQHNGYAIGWNQSFRASNPQATSNERLPMTHHVAPLPPPRHDLTSGSFFKQNNR